MQSTLLLMLTLQASPLPAAPVGGGTDVAQAYRTGMERWVSGDDEGAKRWFEAVVHASPAGSAAASAAWFRLGQIGAQWESSKETGVAFQNALKGGIRGRWRRVAEIEAARLDIEQGKIARALKSLKKLAKGERPGGPTLALLMRAYTLSGQQAAATRIGRRLAIEHPRDEAAPSPDEARLSSDEWFRRAKNLIRDRAYAQALDELDSLTRVGRLASSALYEMGRVHQHFLRDDPSTALRLFQRAYATRGGFKGAALFRIGQVYAKMENYAEAEKTFRRFLVEFPAAPQVEHASYYLGWLPFDHERYPDSLVGFDNYLRRFPQGKRRVFVLWFKGWAQFKLGQFDRAIATWRALPRGNSMVEGKALYWSGVAAWRAGRKEEAGRIWASLNSAYPVSYYSALAARRLGDWPPPWAKAPQAMQPAQQNIHRLLTQATPALAPQLAQVDEWLRLGETHQAGALFSSFRDRFEAGLALKEREEFRLILYPELGLAHRLWRLSGGDLPQRIRGTPGTPVATTRWTMAYPRPFRSLVERRSTEVGIPAAFVWSIMRQESRYRPHQISHADALGLMQMIPKTARKVAEELKTDFRIATFFEPQVNLRYATHYLGALSHRFRGQLVLAAASYNGGPKAVSRWASEHPADDFDELIEDFAYNEARDYCRMVAEHTMRYLALYSAPAERIKVLEQIVPAKLDREFGDSPDY